MNDTVVSLAVAILFLVFIAYEVAGGSPLFPDLHTVSWYASHSPPLKWALVIIPPAFYVGWLLWHLGHVIGK